MAKEKTRCAWTTQDSLYMDYHDKEWGVPQHDDSILFEFLILEGMQAGLSWITILKKRENYRLALDGFNAEKIARYTDRKVNELMNNSGIIRNNLKINSIITNAKSYLALKEKEESFSDYLWQFVDGKPIKNHWENIKSVPAATPLSDKISKDLKKRGFKFVGSTICYAYMQAVGLVNDHTKDCFRYKEIK